MIGQWRQQYNTVRPHAALGIGPRRRGPIPSLETHFTAPGCDVNPLTSIGTKLRPGQHEPSHGPTAVGFVIFGVQEPETKSHDEHRRFPLKRREIGRLGIAFWLIVVFGGILILSNLMDEEAGEPNHPELWLRFAEILDLSREQVQQAALWPETGNLIAWFRSACRDRSTTEGIAALHAYESQIPSVAESKIAGLKRFYSLHTPAALAYFQIHIDAYQEHSEVERRLLESSISEVNSVAVSQSVRETLNALYGILDGVCKRHGINWTARVVKTSFGVFHQLNESPPTLT